MSEYPDGTVAENEAGERFQMRSGQWVRIISLPKYEPKRPELPEPSTMARVGRGMYDIGQGAVQMGMRGLDALPDSLVGDWGPKRAAYEKEKNAEAQTYAEGVAPVIEDNFMGMDWARLGGNVAATAPLAAFAPGTIGQAAALGATAGILPYTESETTDEFLLGKALQGSLGAAGGAAGYKLATILSRYAPQLLGKFRQLSKKAQEGIALQLQQETLDPGQMSDDAIKNVINSVSERLDDYGDLDPAAMVRAARFNRIGMTGDAAPTRSMITRNPSDWTDEQTAARLIGGDRPNPLLDRYQAMRDVALDKADDIAGIGRQSSDVAGDVIDTVQDIGVRTQQQVSRAYTAASKAPGSGSIVENPGQFIDDLTNIYSTFGDDIPSGPRQWAISFVNNGQPGGKTPTVANVADFWKVINSQGMPGGAPGAALNKLRYATRAAVDRTARAGGENAQALRKASLAAARRFGWIRGPANRPTRLVQNIIDGKADTKSIASRLINGSFEELDHLRRFLNDFSPDGVDGAGTWQQVKRAVANDLVSKLKGGMDERSWINVNANQFWKAWQKLGNKRTLFFDADEYQMIDDLARALLDMKRAPEGAAVNYSNTAPTLVKILAQMNKIPVLRGIGNFVAGGLSLGDDYLERQGAMAAAQKALSPVSAPYGQQAILDRAVRLGVVPGAELTNDVFSR